MANRRDFLGGCLAFGLGLVESPDDRTPFSAETEAGTSPDFTHLPSQADCPFDNTAGIATEFTDLDRVTGGLHRTEFVVLAGRPRVGKTAMALNIAEYVAIMAGVPTLFVTLELARREVVDRMLCSQGMIDLNRLRGSCLSTKERKKLVDAWDVLSNAPLFIQDAPSCSVTEIAVCARRLKREAHLELVVIDCLQLLRPDVPNGPRCEQMAATTRRLKCLARELELTILCSAQLERQAGSGDEGRRPCLCQLHQSGVREHDVDVVMFIHREQTYCTAGNVRDVNGASSEWHCRLA